MNFRFWVLLSSMSLIYDLVDGATIKGRVVAAQSQDRLESAEVFLKGTSIGVLAGLSGQYTLSKIPAGNFAIACRFIGYISKEVPLTITSEKTVLSVDFSLSEGSSELEGVHWLEKICNEQRLSLIKWGPSVTVILNKLLYWISLSFASINELEHFTSINFSDGRCYIDGFNVLLRRIF